MENVITLGKLIGVVFVLSPSPPLYFVLFLKNTRNELARPVMGTIFLVTVEPQSYEPLGKRGCS